MRYTGCSLMSPRRIRLLAGAAVAAVVAVAVALGARSDQGPENEPAVAQHPALAPADPTPEPPPPPAATPPPAAPRPMARPDEQSRMMAIRSKTASSPLEALALIESAEKEFPGGALSEERAAAKVDALVRAGRIGAARDAAEAYFGRFPDGPSARHIEMLTGVHPRPPAPDQR